MSGKRKLTPALKASAACDLTARRAMNLLAPEFEYLDPNPDIHALFLEYNAMFFFGKLDGCEVKWSKRMTLCAGLCSYQPSSGFCSIRLSEPLLKLRPRSDLINTLLHEMIHAFIFVFSPVRDRDDHGPVFQSHMNRINQAAGTVITVYHTFHDEVDTYRQHWWQCDGPCRHKRPYFGLVKRAMNRPPGPRDTWWQDHEKNCGGTYTKIKDPPGFKEKQEKKLLRQQQKKEKEKTAPSVKNFFPSTTPDSAKDQPNQEQPKAKPTTAKKPKVAKPEKKDEPTWLDTMRNPDLSTRRPGDATSPRAEFPRYPFAVPEHAVLVAGDDGDFFLVGDVGAVFQLGTNQPQLLAQASRSTQSSSGGLVDLTETDDEGGGSILPAPSRPPTNTNGKAAKVEIIEVD